MMWYYLKQILIFIVISAFATWFMNLLNNRMTYRIVQDIRSQAIRHIQVLPLSYLDQHSTGDIVSRVIADTDILSDGLLLGFTQLFSGIVTIVVTLIFMFSKNVWVTLLVIVLTGNLYITVNYDDKGICEIFTNTGKAGVFPEKSCWAAARWKCGMTPRWVPAASSLMEAL